MSRPPSRAPVASDALVQLLADQLLADLDAAAIEPCLVHVTDHGAERLELGVMPLAGHHPSELLVGFTAPESWHALGVVTGGWAYHRSERGSPRRHRSRVSVVAVLTRTGEVAHRMHIAGEHDLPELPPDDAEGEQIDLLRLALGLSTPPPPCDTGVYWTIEWLSAVLATDPSELLTWDDVADQHPAMIMIRGDEERHGERDPAFSGAGFVELVRSFTRVSTWTTLRGLVAADLFVVPELVSTDAMWFDDGAFARFLLSRCPPLTMVRAQVTDHLRPDLADALGRALDELGVPRSSWPDDEAA